MSHTQASAMPFRNGKPFWSDKLTPLWWKDMNRGHATQIENDDQENCFAMHRKYLRQTECKHWGEFKYY